MKNLLDPALLAFVLGLAAGALRPGLALPAAVPRLLSSCLLLALGLEGGLALAQPGPGAAVGAGLGCALLLALLVPAVGYRLLRRQLSDFDAAAIAAAYGSVSAVAFVVATRYLDRAGVAWGGSMAAALVLMEFPALVVAALVARSLRWRAAAACHGAAATGIAAIGGKGPAGGEEDPAPAPVTRGETLQAALTGPLQFLLAAALLTGLAAGATGAVEATGAAALRPFLGPAVTGVLAILLLDLGLAAVRSLGPLKGKPSVLAAYAFVAPLGHAALALALAAAARLGPGDGALLMLLAASASCLVAPAALRRAIPEANPALHWGMAVGITLPLNVLVGIPLYTRFATVLL